MEYEACRDGILFLPMKSFEKQISSSKVNSVEESIYRCTLKVPK
jgi:hypothetical protein